MWLRALSVPIGIIVLLVVGGGFAAAQDMPTQPGDPVDGDATEGTPTADDATPVEGSTEGDVPVEATVESEIDAAPAYEEEYTEDLRERYFRITEDFISPQEIGLGSIGQVPFWSRGIIKAGPFRFTPYLSASIGWESNVFLNDENKVASWFWQARGGLVGDAKFMADKLVIRTSLEFLYRDYTEEEIGGDWQGIAGLAVRYNFPVGFWISAGVKYTRFFDPVFVSDVPTRAAHDSTRFFVDIGLNELFQRLVGNRWRLLLGFDTTTHSYEDQEFSLGNRVEARAYIELQYRFIRDLWAFVRYTHGEMYADSKRLNDGSSDQISFGVNGAYPISGSGKLMGQLWFGYRNDTYDKARLYKVGSDEIYTDDDDSAGRLTVGAQLRYLMSVKTTITLNYTRTTAFSLEGNYQFVDRVDLYGNHILARSLIGRLGGFWELAQPSAAGDVYRYGIGVGLRHGITDFMDISASYDATLRDDKDPIREVDYVNHRVELALVFYLR